MVASDRALRDIARLRPRTLEELQLANGIGPAKAKQYGAGLLDVVRVLGTGSDERKSLGAM
jgi:ATP-dependent DNA helicase RecQ